MNQIILTKSCRICLEASKKLHSLYTPIEEDDEPPFVMVNLVTGIELEEPNEEPDLPKYICRNCSLALNLAFEFRDRALRSQQTLEEFKATSCSAYDEVQSVKQDENEYDDSLDVHTDSYTITDMPHFMQVEALDMPFDESEIKHEYLDDNSKEECDDMQGLNMVAEELYDDLADEQNEEQNLPPTIKRKSVVKEGLDTRRVKNRSRLPTSTSTQRKDSNKNVHICDICGNIYDKRGRMMEHRRRHDKELRFACEICGERFHQREKLRKHMFSHTGGNPLKCSYCSRTFFYKSVLQSHEAVHLGHRPYVCEICKKDFAYAHALKKHELIHANIKQFHCTYCNKDFRLPHHMKQHEETKTHQAAVMKADNG